MESRTRFAIGGMTTVAASVAVICVVALTNTVALSEAAGSSIEAGSVVVPSSGVAPTARPSATPSPDTDVPPSAPVAEVVPAPAPEVVSPREAAPAPQPPTGNAQTPSEAEMIAEARASGSWVSARDWAARLGWPEGRIDAWVAKHERSRGELSDGSRDDEASTDGSMSEIGGNRVEFDEDSKSGWEGYSEKHQKDSGADRRESRPEISTWPEISSLPQTSSVPEMSTMKTQEQSPVTVSPQERPAQAGADADRRSMKPGGGEKKDRSLDSPDRRDR